MTRDPLPEQITIGAKYMPAMLIMEQADADVYFECLVEHALHCFGGERADAEKVERDNLGYFAGYYDHETRARVERLFRCAHPIFGAIAERGAPTLEEAMNAGLTMGAAMKEKRDHE